MNQFNHLELSAQIARSGIKKGELANTLQVHPNTLSNWVNGRAEPRPAQLLDLLVHLGCDVHSVKLVDYWKQEQTP